MFPFKSIGVLCNWKKIKLFFFKYNLRLEFYKSTKFWIINCWNQKKENNVSVLWENWLRIKWPCYETEAEPCWTKYLNRLPWRWENSIQHDNSNTRQGSSINGSPCWYESCWLIWGLFKGNRPTGIWIRNLFSWIIKQNQNLYLMIYTSIHVEKVLYITVSSRDQYWSGGSNQLNLIILRIKFLFFIFYKK